MTDKNQWINDVVERARIKTRNLSKSELMFVNIGIPMRAGGDSVDVEVFLADEWIGDLTTEDLHRFEQEFRNWYARQLL